MEVFLFLRVFFILMNLLLFVGLLTSFFVKQTRVTRPMSKKITIGGRTDRCCSLVIGIAVLLSNFFCFFITQTLFLFPTLLYS